MIPGHYCGKRNWNTSLHVKRRMHGTLIHTYFNFNYWYIFRSINRKNIFLSIVEIYIKIFILLLLFLILCGILCHRKITFLIDIASFELEAVKAEIQESKKPCHSLSVTRVKPEYNPPKCLIIRVSGRHNKHFDF